MRSPALLVLLALTASDTSYRTVVSSGWRIHYSATEAIACSVERTAPCSVIFASLPADADGCSYVENELVSAIGSLVTYRTSQECMGHIPTEASTRWTTVDLVTGQRVSLSDVFGNRSLFRTSPLRSERGNCAPVPSLEQVTSFQVVDYQAGVAVVRVREPMPLIRFTDCGEYWGGIYRLSVPPALQRPLSEAKHKGSLWLDSEP